MAGEGGLSFGGCSGVDVELDFECQCATAGEITFCAEVWLAARSWPLQPHPPVSPQGPLQVHTGGPSSLLQTSLVVTHHHPEVC